MLLRHLCPLCGGPVSESELGRGAPCSKCARAINSLVSESAVNTKRGRKSVLAIHQGNSCTTLEPIVKVVASEELRDFEKFFKRTTGKTFWSIQKSWAKRMLSGESFALIAPTGVGKSTLLLSYAIYKANRKSKVLYIVPTRELMKQVASNITHMISTSKSLLKEINVYTSDTIKNATKDELSTLRPPFIAVLTHAFIFRNKKMFDNVRFDLIIVDDFDALLKSSSLIDLILKCLGISEEAINLAKKVINLKSEVLYYKYLGNEEKTSELQDQLYEVKLQLAKEINYDEVGQLLIASATGRARGTRVKVLRELLGFEVGSIMDYLRNIVEAKEFIDKVNLAKLLKKLHGGTLLFVSRDLGIKKARELVKELEYAGISAALANSRKALDLLRNGKARVLVGVATYYGILTRGIDEPLTVYNTVFLGVPKFEVNIDAILQNPRSLVSIMLGLAHRGYVLNEDEKELIRRMNRLSPSKVRVLQLALRTGFELSDKLNEILNLILRVIPKVSKAVKEYVNKEGKLVLGHYIIIKKGNTYVAQIPDVMTYIQASGRCSRLYKGRMTLGLSIILYEDEDLLQIFEKKLKSYVPSSQPKPLTELNLSEIKKKQIKSRSEGRGKADVDRIKSALIIVESPTKAKTIAKMFGAPGRRYIGDYIAYETVISHGDKVYVATIAPTLGHILDLAVDVGIHGVKLEDSKMVPVYTTIKRCYECGYQFTDESSTCPRCGSIRIRNSKKIIDALRKISQEVDVVILATDPDDEGEKIAYDVYLVLRPYTNNFMRIEFHEVTRTGLLKALTSPRNISMNRVNAQIIRRVDDRLVGFELSSVLKEHFSKYWLGGGRVQSPVLAWITDRYLEYLKNRGYLIVALLPVKSLRVKMFVTDKEKASKILDLISKSGITLRLVNTKVADVSPKPPYTTDALLFDASYVLKLSPGKIMRVAQDLFELGLITYHRTDSTHVSAAGVEIARELLHSLGHLNNFVPRKWGSEGTHECIRPTRPIKSLDELDVDYAVLARFNLTWYHKKLYEMITERFLASQMNKAKIEFSTYDVLVDGVKLTSIEVPTRVIEPGFTKVSSLRVYEELRNRPEVTLRPDAVKLIRSSKSKLYTTSDIIRLMKEKNIGRPSTYAKAIDNNLKHGYIILSKKYMYLIPTKLGLEVSDFIKSYYPELASEKATRELEELIDVVREGMLNRSKALTYLLSDLISIRTNYLVKTVNADLSTNEEATIAET